MSILDRLRNALRTNRASPSREEPHPGPFRLTPHAGSGLDFVVIDVETTGLYSGTSDRIVEIAIVSATTKGVIKDEYSTLINPERDVGPTSIHGVRAADVTSAPTFRDICGDIADRINGVPIVGHNVSFDIEFLQAEYRRLGVSLPKGDMVCTLDLSYRASLPSANRRLQSCCEALGIQHPGGHSALEDARATALLLSGLVSLLGTQYVRPLSQRRSRLQPEALRALTRSGRIWTRTTAAEAGNESQSYLARLVATMPLGNPALFGQTDAAAKLSYLDLLDRALLDRHISPDEAEGLIEFAAQLGMSTEAIEAAHLEYLQELVAAAKGDGVVTSVERQDLELVTRWLGLPADHLDRALRESRRDLSVHKKSLDGKSVCFTGESALTVNSEGLPRYALEQAAIDAGMIVKSGVSKKLDFLVVADALTQSRKAAKARAYEVPVVAETVFCQLVGLRTD